MNKLILLLFSSFIVFSVSTASFAQKGELDRFKTESIEPENNKVRLYPNPSVDHLSVRIENSTLAEANFTVHNIIGNEVDVKVEEVGSNEYRIKVKDLAPGYYLLAIRDDQGYFRETYKFLKK